MSAAANAGNDAKAGNTTTKVILEQLQQLTKMVAELQSDQKTQNTEILGKLTEIITRQSTAAPRARGTGAGKTTAAAPQKKFFTSSLYWFKEEFKKNRADTIKRFGITDKMMKDVDKQLNDDEKLKSKTGDAKLLAEATLFWNLYAKGKQNDEMNKKIKAAFEVAREAYNKENKTPAKEDDAATDATDAADAADGGDDDAGGDA